MTKNPSKTRHFQTARAVVDALGGTGKVAQLCDVSPSAVSAWLANGLFPPARFLTIFIALGRVGATVEKNLFREVRKGESPCCQRQTEHV